MRDASRGPWLGFVGTAAFSLTLPAAKVAVAALHPMIVGVGRPVVAAVPAHERPGRLFWACSLFGLAVLALVVLAVAIGRNAPVRTSPAAVAPPPSAPAPVYTSPAAPGAMRTGPSLRQDRFPDGASRGK